MVEGSLWVYGHTDLTDFYRGVLTLRQIWNRIICLPHEAPINRVLEDEQEKAEAARQVMEIGDRMAQFKQANN